jgi:GNAT superfamily N-acetyltransferase
LTSATRGFICAAMHPNGYVQLPPGKLANAVTWLELLQPAAEGLQAQAGIRLEKLGPADAALFRKLYRDIGRNWLWAGLMAQTEAEIAFRLGRADMLSFAAYSGPDAIGLLDMQVIAEDAEIVNFGLVPAMTGKSVGPWLMDEAKRIAQRAGLCRLWLHTCSFDHPKAITFYRRQGFRAFAVGYEIMDDPRVLGLLPRDAAPHVPLIGE